MNPQRLRKIAAWLDTSDKIVQDYINLLRAEDALSVDEYTVLTGFLKGTEMQDDLRQWADELDAEEAK